MLLVLSPRKKNIILEKISLSPWKKKNRSRKECLSVPLGRNVSTTFYLYDGTGGVLCSIMMPEANESLPTARSFFAFCDKIYRFDFYSCKCKKMSDLKWTGKSFTRPPCGWRENWSKSAFMTGTNERKERRSFSGSKVLTHASNTGWCIDTYSSLGAALSTRCGTLLFGCCSPRLQSTFPSVHKAHDSRLRWEKRNPHNHTSSIMPGRNATQLAFGV